MNDTVSDTTPYQRLVADEVLKARARRDALRQLKVEERGAADIPPFHTLREWLTEPDEQLSWRISSLLPSGGRVVLSAQFKAGKTTVISNLLRSLVDGDQFLGQFHVTPVDGHVGLFDFEMSRHNLKRWLRDQGIARADQIIPVALRGSASSFDLLDTGVRSEWAARLRENGIAFLVVDCLRPILDATGLDEHKDAGRFLVALDALCKEANIAEAVVVHHMGHGAERARGDSRIRDWPDVEWSIVREKEGDNSDNPGAPRFFKAYGRDVDVPESQLVFDALTRRLSLRGGSNNGTVSRRDAKHLKALPTILTVLDEHGECNATTVKKVLKDAGSDLGRDAVEQALAFGRKEGYLEHRAGPYNSTLHKRAAKSWNLSA